MPSKSVLEILNDIRNQRNAELLEKRRTDISVIKVENLGAGEQSNEQLYRLVERQEFEDKPAITIEKYYTYIDGIPRCIAVKSPETDEILPYGINGNEIERWNVLKEDVAKSAIERDMELQAIARELGMTEEEITALSEIDLEQKLEEKAEKGEDDSEQNVLSQEQGDNKSEKFTQKQVEKMDIKNEIRTDSVIDSKGKTLEKELGLEEYTKIGIVHSYRLNELTNSDGKSEKRENLKFGLVGQRKDGSYEKIPESKIRMYRGNNTEMIGIKNPQEVETQNDDCIFEVVGKENKRLSIRQQDPYGIPEAYIGDSSRDNDSNVVRKVQDQYDGTERTDVEVRTLFNENRGTENIKNMKDEAKTHPQEEKVGIDEVDGERDTGHHHVIDTNSILYYEGQEMTVQEIAELPRFKISAEEFVNIYNRLAEGETQEEDFENQIFNRIEDTVNDDVTNPRGH